MLGSGLACTPRRSKPQAPLRLQRTQESVTKSSDWGGPGPICLGPAVTKAVCLGTVPPVASALTEAVQDVVKVIEIVVAFVHNSLIAHGVIEPAVGVSHGARTGQGDRGAEGKVTRKLVTSTEDKRLKRTKF